MTELKHQRELFVKDSVQHVKDSIQHIQDSLANDKHYQDSLQAIRDSLNAVRQAEELWKKQHTIVITCDSDSIFHYTSNCETINKKKSNYHRGCENISLYHLTTLYEVDSMGYKLCDECERIKRILSDYESGEIGDEEYFRENLKEELIDEIKEEYNLEEYYEEREDYWP